jgi:copper chaperone NosL
MMLERPGEFTDAAKAWYLRSDAIQSPMGMHLAAFPDKESAERVRKGNPGLLYRWYGVRLLVAREWVR